MQKLIAKIEVELTTLRKTATKKESEAVQVTEENGCSPEKTKGIRQQYVDMISNASIIGPVAADNLQRFIDELNSWMLNG